MVVPCADQAIDAKMCLSLGIFSPGFRAIQAYLNLFQSILRYFGPYSGTR